MHGTLFCLYFVSCMLYVIRTLKIMHIEYWMFADVRWGPVFIHILHCVMRAYEMKEVAVCLFDGKFEKKIDLFSIMISNVWKANTIKCSTITIKCVRVCVCACVWTHITLYLCNIWFHEFLGFKISFQVVFASKGLTPSTITIGQMMHAFT